MYISNIPRPVGGEGFSPTHIPTHIKPKIYKMLLIASNQFNLLYLHYPMEEKYCR